MENNTTVHSELDTIKNEINVNLNKKNKTLPWNSIAITAILGALTLVSIAQTLASVKIFNKLKTGEVKASTGAPQNNSVQNLPDMVGGC